MTDSAPQLRDLFRCFQGVIPSTFATADRNGIPNVTLVSQVFLIDDRHVALSCQFFNKTRRNLDQNPRAAAEVLDPVTLQAYRLRLRFLRSETSGALFDSMSMRIQAIASHTGMTGIFRLIASDVFEVERVEAVEGFLTDVPPAQTSEVSLAGLRTELRGLQWVSEHINGAQNLESLLDAALEALDAYFAFLHTMVLLYDETTNRLVTIASHGYGESGVGAEVAMGEGLIGTVARERRVLRMTGLEASLRYGRTIRRETLSSTPGQVAPEIPLPGLGNAQSTLVIPLALGDRLIGVLAAESTDPMRFGEWDETYLAVIGNQIALGIDRMLAREDDAHAPAHAEPVVRREPPPPAAPMQKHTLIYYRNDDCIFIDDDYLIRNVPARILWKLLNDRRARGRTEFTNRELRLDDSLGLPEVKDNLESRLILLRRRLDEKSPNIRIVPTGRGKFTLDVAAELELVER